MRGEKIYTLHAGWLKDAWIGNLIIGSDRKQQVIAFEYASDWLESHPDFFLDPEIFPYSGRQYAERGNFLFLEDASPDRWGRELMKRREQDEAAREGRIPKDLSEQDFLLGVEDSIRMGGIRISDGKDFIAHREIKVPPITGLRELEDSAHRFEKAGAILQETELENLVSVGSSLGGARPKINVVDEQGELWIAKFQSDRDRNHTESWEFVTHELGVMCGLYMAEGKVESLGGRSCYLTKRFDRRGQDRVHFASAMTMLGKHDGDDASFLDIAECISRISADAKADLQELWRRIAFSVIINNTDCHLRNHGFLLTEKGWRLSPAYDINPNLYGKEFALTIDGSHRNPTWQTAIDTSPFYEIADPMEEMEKMQHIIAESYQPLAKKLKIPGNEIQMMKNFITRK